MNNLPLSTMLARAHEMWRRRLPATIGRSDATASPRRVRRGYAHGLMRKSPWKVYVMLFLMLSSIVSPAFALGESGPGPGGLKNTGSIANAGTIWIEGSTEGLEPVNGGTYNFAGDDQAIPSSEYNKLILSGTGTKTAAGNTTVAETLLVNSGVTFATGASVVQLRGTLVEQGKLTGKILKQDTLEASDAGTSAFGNLGVSISYPTTSTGTTSVLRTTGTALTSATTAKSSIGRYFAVTPSMSSTSGTSIVFSYDETELQGQQEATLALWRSIDSGATWRYQGGVVNAANNTISASGISPSGWWTASDTLHPLGTFDKEGSASAIAIVSGNDQSGSVGAALANALVVRVTDAFGSPVANQSVTFSIDSIPAGSTNQSLSVQNVQTNASGTASTSLTLGRKPGTFRVSATSTGLTGSPLTFTATAVPGAALAAQSTLTPASASLTANGTATTVLTVTAKDVYGNPLTAGGASVTIAKISGTGSLSAVTDQGNGTYTATVTAPTTAGSGVFAAAVGTDSVKGGATWRTEVLVSYSAGAATQLAISTVGTQTAGSPFDVTVTLADANGNAVNNTGAASVVTLSKKTGTGTLGGTLSGAIGVGQSAVTIAGVTYDKAETGVVLTATGSGVGSLVAGKTGESNAFAVVSEGAAVKLAFTTPAKTVTAGAVSDTMTVQLQDSFGNGVNATSNVTVDLSSTSDSLASFFLVDGTTSATSLTIASGSNSASFKYRDTKAGKPTVRAADRAAGVNAATQQQTINAGSAAALAFVTQPGGGPGGSAWSQQPVVAIQDAFGNTVPGSTASVVLAIGTNPSGGTLSGTVTQATDTGLATFSGLSINKAGTGYTLTAASDGLTGATSSSFTITGASAVQLALATPPALTVGSARGASTVSLLDANGNAASSGVAQTIYLSASGTSGTFFNAGTGGQEITNVTIAANASSATFWFAATTAGSYIITASDETPASNANGLPNAVDTTVVNVGAPATIAVNGGNNQSAAAGSLLATAPSVVVKDAGQNPVANTVVIFAVTSGGGTLTGDTATTNASGIATLGSWRLGSAVGSQAISATIQNSSPAVTVEFQATATVGSASAISVLAGNEQTASAGSALATAPRVAVTDANNNAVAGVQVVFVITAGGGRVTGDTVATNALGTATVGSWTLGTATGSNTLKAYIRGSNPEIAATFTATSIPGHVRAASSTLTPATLTLTANGTATGTLVVTAKDQYGNALTSGGETVSIAKVSGSGSIGPVTDHGNGTYSATVTAPTKAGSGVFAASIGADSVKAGGAWRTEAVATYTAGPATQLLFSSINTQTVATAFDVTVTLADAFGNPVKNAGAAGLVTLSRQAGTGTFGGTLSGSIGIGASSVTIAGVTYDKVESGVSLLATGSGDGSSVNGKTGISNTFTVVSEGSPVRLAFTTPKRTVVAGSVSERLTVELQDVHGLAVPAPTDTTVWLGTTSPTGSFRDTANASTITSMVMTAGSSSVSFLYTGTSAGTDTLTAESVALNPAVQQIDVFAALADRLVFTTSYPALTAGVLSDLMTVQLRDAYGNQVDAVSNATLSLSTTSPRGSFRAATGGQPVTQITIPAGVSSESFRYVDTTAGQPLIVARMAGVDSAAQRQNVHPGLPSAARSQFGPLVASLLANSSESIPLNVVVHDAFDNVIMTGGIAVSIVRTSGTGSVGPVADTLPGVYAARVTPPSTVGFGTFVALVEGDTVRNGQSGAAIATIAYRAAAAASLAISSGDGQTAPVGAAVSVRPSVIVKDSLGNPVAGAAVIFAAGPGHGIVVGDSAISNDAGIATVGSWTLGTAAGIDTLRAALAGRPGIFVNFVATAVARGPAALLMASADSLTAPAGQALTSPPAVVVKDAFGNRVAGALVVFSVASGGGSVAGDSVTTNPLGLAMVGRWVLGPVAGRQTLSARVAGVDTLSIVFSAFATAASPAQLTKQRGDLQAATVGTAVKNPVGVLVADVFGNAVSGVAVTFAVTAGGGTVTGARVSTDSAGIASLGSWTLGPAVGLNELTATVEGSSPLLSVTFTATGLASSVNFAYETIDFGVVPVSTSKDSIFAFVNTGNDTLRITNVISTNSAFRVDTISVVGGSARKVGTAWHIKPGDVATGYVRFTPAKAGLDSGLIVVVSNSPSSPDTILARGFGATYKFALGVASMNFGTVPVNSVKDSAVLISNTGNQPVRVLATVAGSPFITVNPGTRNLTVSATVNDTIRVAPTQAGPMAATIRYLNTTTGTTDSLLVTASGTVTGVEDLQGLPRDFVLANNFPNPFNPATTLRFGVPSRSHVRLTVFNALGQPVAELVNAIVESGYHQAVFDASALPSGTYFARIVARSESSDAREFVATHRMALIK